MCHIRTVINFIKIQQSGSWDNWFGDCSTHLDPYVWGFDNDGNVSERLKVMVFILLKI